MQSIMLNDVLYKALVAAFGSVVVDNQGVGADIIISERNGIPDWHLPKGDECGEHGEQYRVNCPFCRGRDGEPDYKHHLYISYLSFARPNVYGTTFPQGRLYAHCFRCDAMKDPLKRAELEFRIQAGMSCVSPEEDTAVVNMSAELPKSREELYTVSTDVTLEGVKTWLPDFHLCTDGMDPDVEEYLDGRDIDCNMMSEFSIGWGAVKTPRIGRLLKGGVPWIIVPVIMNGELKGVQARCPDKFITSEDDIKYWTHPSMRKSTVVYNLDRARQFGVGVVCEGVFDVFKVGGPGVCIFGKNLSTAQRNLLNTIGKGLILLPDTDKHKDFDTVADAQKMASEWNARNVFQYGVHVVVLPEKDAGAMSRGDVWTNIMAQLPQDSSMFHYVSKYVLSRI